MAQVLALAQELPHAASAAKNKQTNIYVYIYGLKIFFLFFDFDTWSSPKIRDQIQAAVATYAATAAILDPLIQEGHIKA